MTKHRSSANPEIETIITVVDGADGLTPEMLRKRPEGYVPPWEREQDDRLAP